MTFPKRLLEKYAVEEPGPTQHQQSHRSDPSTTSRPAASVPEADTAPATANPVPRPFGILRG